MTDDPLQGLIREAARTLPVAPPDGVGLSRAVQRARRRRRTRRMVAAGVVVGAAASITAVAAASGGSSVHRVNLVSPSTVPTSFPSVPPGPGPTSPPVTTVPVTVPPAVSLPVSVESDAQMIASGNNGPSSSILAAQSCLRQGATVSATGGYTNGDFAPNVYNRYGDVVELLAYSESGAQLADLSTESRPAIGGYGSWRVTGHLTSSATSPSRCVVVAQPTHAFQGAPSGPGAPTACGSDDQPQKGYNLDYIEQTGTTCQIAKSVALASVNNPAVPFGAPYTADGFSCTSQRGPATGQLYYTYTCTGSGAQIFFKSRTP